MAEEAEKESGPENPAHLLALSGASREKADAYLELQMEEMRAEEPYKISHYRLRRFSGWAKAAFEFSLGLIALCVVTGLGAAVWNAAHDDGLVIEAFSVPPDLAARGFTGQVVATLSNGVRVNMDAAGIDQAFKIIPDFSEGAK